MHSGILLTLSNHPRAAVFHSPLNSSRFLILNHLRCEARFRTRQVTTHTAFGDFVLHNTPQFSVRGKGVLIKSPPQLGLIATVQLLRLVPRGATRSPPARSSRTSRTVPRGSPCFLAIAIYPCPRTPLVVFHNIPLYSLVAMLGSTHRFRRAGKCENLHAARDNTGQDPNKQTKGRNTSCV